MPTTASAAVLVRRWLSLAIAVVMVLNVVVFGVSMFLRPLPLSFTRYFDVNQELSLPTWFNAALLTTGVVLAVIAAFETRDRHQRRAWGALAGGLAFLSIDETVQIHEALPAFLGMERDFVTHEWLIPGVGLAAVGVAVLVVLLRPLGPAVKRGLAVAVVVYGFGALVVEGVSGYFVRLLGSGVIIDVFVLPISRVVEESMEMFGAVLAVTTIIAHLERQGLFGPGSADPGLEVTGQVAVRQTAT